MCSFLDNGEGAYHIQYRHHRRRRAMHASIEMPRRDLSFQSYGYAPFSLRVSPYGMPLRHAVHKIDSEIRPRGRVGCHLAMYTLPVLLHIHTCLAFSSTREACCAPREACSRPNAAASALNLRTSFLNAGVTTSEQEAFPLGDRS